MSTTVHQRKPYTYTNMNQSNSPLPTTASSNSTTIPNSSSNFHNEPTLTSSTLLKSNPIHHSKVYKLKIPFIYTITPTFLLSIIQIILYPILKLCNIQIKPFWVERYFILIGDYLYKFQPNSRGSMGRNNMKMKGCPIDLKSMTVSSLRLANNGSTVISASNTKIVLEDIPSFQNCNGYFTITTNGKSKHYATETQLEAQTWLNTLHQARQECITTSMGHSRKPTSRQVEYVNRMGKSIVDRKERITNLIRKKELDEIELMCMNGSGGSASALPRGYFG